MDFFALLLAAVTAFTIRDIPQILILKPKLYDFPFQDYIKIVLIVIPIFILIYSLEGLYKIRATRKFWKEVLRIVTATSLGFLFIIVAIFLKREWFSSRFIILAAWTLGFTYVLIGRYLIQKIQKTYITKPIF